MTARERKMFIVLVGVACLVGIVVGAWQWFLRPLQDANRAIDDLNAEIGQKVDSIQFVKQEQKRLEKYKALSLPSNPDQAAADYAKFLKPLLGSCGLTGVDLQPPPSSSLKLTPTQGKKAGHMTLSFTVRAQGDISSVIKTLSALRKAPIAHRVKSLSLSRADDSGKDTNKLNVQMTIEALIVNRADNLNPFLTAPDTRLVALESIAGLHGAPLGMALGPWLASKESIRALVAKQETTDRNYVAIRDRNVFVGLRPEEPEAAVGPVDGGIDALEYVRLSHTDPTNKEAFLRNIIFNTPEMRLRPKSPGYQVFQIRSEDREHVLVKGKVLRVDQREVYFQVAEDMYGIHIGQSMRDAMKRPLSADEMETLELTSLYDSPFAEQEMKAIQAKVPAKNSPPTKGKMKKKL